MSPADNEQPKDDHQGHTQDVSLTQGDTRGQDVSLTQGETRGQDESHTQGDTREYFLKAIIHYPAVFTDKSND